MGMTVTPLGVGEAFDAHETNASVLVECDGFTLLIDCGHSAVGPLWRRLSEPDAVDAVYLTHHHADHALGLIPVLDRWGYDRRRKGLAILTTEAGIAQLRSLLAAGFIPLDADSPFPITFHAIERLDHIGPLGMRVAPTSHSIANHAIRLTAGGRHFAYSGDGRPTDASRALYADAHLLLHECFMPEAAPELLSHCDLPTVAGIAGPGRVGLYHVQAGQREVLRQRIAGEPRLFVPEAGDRLEV